MTSSTPHAPAGASDAEAAEGRVYMVSGEDWDEIVAAANEAGDFESGERIVINMGPQHPSTHGVLRLVLTLEGETVVEVRPSIGYLHTGIEKNMEYRTWTQGVTFCTRADYLMPLFNEAAYCLGVERLLGIEDKIPERAQIIRVLMLELNRISSHLGGIAPMGLELGATTIYTQGARLRERNLDLLELITGLRMNHAYIRPGGVAQDLPPGALEAIRAFLDSAPELVRQLRTLIDANPIFIGRNKGVAYLDLASCMALGVTGPILRSTGLPWDLRKSQPYCGYESYEFDVPVNDMCDAYGRYLIRMDEIEQSMRIVRQCVDRLAARGSPGPDEGSGHDPGRQDRLAGPAVARPGRPRSLAGAHRAHHGPVHGGTHSPLQADHRGFPGAGRPGVRRDRIPPRRTRRARGERRRNPAVPRAPPRPVVHAPAVGRRDVRGRPGSRPDPGDREPRSGDGGRGQVMPFSDDVRARLDADAARIIGQYPQSRSALLPLLHLVQSEEGYVSEDGIEYCAGQLGLTEADVTGVVSFYTMYKRRPVGEYHVGVCTNTVCGVLGGNQILAELHEHLGVADDEVTPDGRVSLEHLECNAACVYAPVMMVNWEFFDNMTPQSARQLADDLRAGNPVTPTRGPRRLVSWREAARILAGFNDDLATEGPAAGPADLVGLKVAKEHGWTAPEPGPAGEQAKEPR